MIHTDIQVSMPISLCDMSWGTFKSRTALKENVEEKQKVEVRSDYFQQIP